MVHWGVSAWLWSLKHQALYRRLNRTSWCWCGWVRCTCMTVISEASSSLLKIKQYQLTLLTWWLGEMYLHDCDQWSIKVIIKDWTIPLMLLTWWFREVYLHDCDQWGVQVVSLGFLCVENLHRVRPARNGENGLNIPTPSLRQHASAHRVTSLQYTTTNHAYGQVNEVTMLLSRFVRWYPVLKK